MAAGERLMGGAHDITRQHQDSTSTRGRVREGGRSGSTDVQNHTAADSMPLCKPERVREFPTGEAGRRLPLASKNGGGQGLRAQTLEDQRAREGPQHVDLN